MNDLVIRNANIVSAPKNEEPLRGADLQSLREIPKGDLWIRDGKIERIVDQRSPEQVEEAEVESVMTGGVMELDAEGRVVIPGFVDCHTHSLWAGDRMAEWEAKLLGKDYLETLKEGGGILSTVRAIRQATQKELTDNLLTQLWKMLANGTTTVEVKSGYGLDTDSELKMLRAIADADSQWPGKVFATACIGHAIDPELSTEDFIQRTIKETLPAVSKEFPGVAIDGYCEKGSWDLDQTLQLCDAAIRAGHPVRMHADQFHDLGMIPEAIRRDFVSVDHLEATKPAHLKQLAESETFGVCLPCSGFHLDDRYADAKSFVEHGGKLALATNNNPGSAPCYSMPMTIALASRKCGLSPAQCLNASTHNAACLLRYGGSRSSRIGRIDVQMRADFAILDTFDYRSLGYQIGGNPVWKVICGGRIN